MRLKVLVYFVTFLFGCSTASNLIAPWIFPTIQSSIAFETENEPWQDDQEGDSQESESQSQQSEEKEKEKEEQFKTHFFALLAHHSQITTDKFYVNNLRLPSAIQLEINTPPPKR
jgi:hypothetical protein